MIDYRELLKTELSKKVLPDQLPKLSEVVLTALTGTQIGAFSENTSPADGKKPLPHELPKLPEPSELSELPKLSKHSELPKPLKLSKLSKLSEGASSPPQLEGIVLLTNASSAQPRAVSPQETALSPPTLLAELPKPPEGVCSLPQQLPPNIVQGLARLQRMPTPAGWDHARWDAAIGGMNRFVAAGWPKHAFALAWDATELFGLLPAAPAAIDAMGLALMLGSADVVAIDAHGADILTHQHGTGRIERDRHRFYRRTGGRRPRLAWEIGQ